MGSDTPKRQLTHKSRRRTPRGPPRIPRSLPRHHKGRGREKKKKERRTNSSTLSPSNKKRKRKETNSHTLPCHKPGTVFPASDGAQHRPPAEAVNLFIPARLFMLPSAMSACPPNPWASPDPPCLSCQEIMPVCLRRA